MSATPMTSSTSKNLPGLDAWTTSSRGPGTLRLVIGESVCWPAWKAVDLSSLSSSKGGLPWARKSASGLVMPSLVARPPMNWNEGLSTPPIGLGVALSKEPSVSLPWPHNAKQQQLKPQPQQHRRRLPGVGSPTHRPTPLPVSTLAPSARDCPSPARSGTPPAVFAPAPTAARGTTATELPGRGGTDRFSASGLTLPPPLSEKAAVTCGGGCALAFAREATSSLNLANCRMLLEADSATAAPAAGSLEARLTATNGAALALVALSADGWRSAAPASGEPEGGAPGGLLSVRASAEGPLAPGSKRTREQRSPCKGGEQSTAAEPSGRASAGAAPPLADAADPAVASPSATINLADIGASHAVGSIAAVARDAARLRVLPGRVVAPKNGVALPPRAQDGVKAPLCFFARLGGLDRPALSFSFDERDGAPRRPSKAASAAAVQQRLQQISSHAAASALGTADGWRKPPMIHGTSAASPLPSSATPIVVPPLAAAVTAPVDGGKHASRAIAVPAGHAMAEMDVGAAVALAAADLEGVLCSAGSLAGSRTESPAGSLSSLSSLGSDEVSLCASASPIASHLGAASSAASLGSCSLTDSRSASAASNAPTIAAMDDE